MWLNCLPPPGRPLGGWRLVLLAHETVPSDMIVVTSPHLCLQLPDVFEAGHSCTETEARALERLLLFRLKYFVTSWLQKGMPPAEAQLHLTEFVKTYEFTSRPPNEALEPIQIEALRISKEIVTAHLAKKGIEVEEEQLIRHAAEVAKLPQIQTRAQAIISLRKRAARDILGRPGDED
jgi:hypothetical protein